MVSCFVLGADEENSSKIELTQFLDEEMDGADEVALATGDRPLDQQVRRARAAAPMPWRCALLHRCPALRAQHPAAHFGGTGTRAAASRPAPPLAQGFADEAEAEDDAEESVMLEGVDPVALQASVYTGSMSSGLTSGGGVIADRKGNLYTPAMFPDKPVVRRRGQRRFWGLLRAAGGWLLLGAGRRCRTGSRPGLALRSRRSSACGAVPQRGSSPRPCSSRAAACAGA
jgi:hypothetical protein